MPCVDLTTGSNAGWTRRAAGWKGGRTYLCSPGGRHKVWECTAPAATVPVAADAPAAAAAPVAAAAPAAAAAPVAARRRVVTDGDSDEEATVAVLAAEGGAQSPKIKIEPAEQVSGWAALGELEVPLPPPLPGAARCSFQPGCRCELCRTIVLDDSDDEFGGAAAVRTAGRAGGRGGRGGARGGRGVPKTCRVCGVLKRGGCACVKTNNKGI